MKLREYDVVRLRHPLPEHQLEAGALGAIVMVYTDPPGYEVEFTDADGITLALVTLYDADVEKA